MLLLLIAIVSIYGVLGGEYTCPVAPAVRSTIQPSDPRYASRPFVDGAVSFLDGEVKPYLGDVIPVTSPIVDGATGERTIIGKLAQMGEKEALQAVASARKAWSNGQGVWPQMSAAERILAVERVVSSLKKRRAEIVNVLMWEICKTIDDAALEFDRTIQFIESTLQAYRDSDASSSWKTVSGVLARVRRAAVGIIMCLGPFNYPLNETYTTLIPALLSGNVLILKLPQLGGLAHVLTMEAYAAHLPPGVINFVSGSGRVTMSPMMRSGFIDALAFIGGSSAADAIIKEHPNPHRLKLFLQLEVKAPSILAL